MSPRSPSRQAAEAWLAQDPDPTTADELRQLIAACDRGEPAAIRDLDERFTGLLEFGTAALDRLFAPFEVHVPTLTLWGRHETAVGRSTTLTEKQYMRGPYRFVEVDAGHWLIQERFDECSSAILEHLKAHRQISLLQGRVWREVGETRACGVTLPLSP